MILPSCKKRGLAFIIGSLIPLALSAQADSSASSPDANGVGALVLMILLLVTTFIAAIYLWLLRLHAHRCLRRLRRQPTLFCCVRFGWKPL